MNEIDNINEKYNAILEALDRVGLGIDIINRDYEIIFQNNILKERFGDSTGKLCHEKYMKSNSPCDFCRIRTVMETNQVESIELTGADGRIYNLISAPLKNPDGKIDKVAEIILDITDQKESENKIKESEELFRNLFEGANDGILIVDPDTLQFFMGNETICNILGYSSDEIKNLNIRDIHPKDKIQKILNIFEKLKTREIQIAREIPVKRKDNTLIYTDINSSVIKLSGKTYLMGIFRDITEKKLNDQKLINSELRFRSMIEHTTDAVFCYEFEKPIPIDLSAQEQVRLMYNCILVDCNLVCAQSYGAENIEDVIGHKLTDLFGTTPNSLDEFFKKLIDNDYHIVDGVGIEKLPNGEERYFLNNGHGIIEDDKLIRIWGTFRDITDRKIAENRLKISEEKFRNLFEKSSNAIALTDISGKIIDVNFALEKLFGYSAEELINQIYMELPLYPENTISTVKERFNDLIKKSYLEPHEYKIIKKDKSTAIIKSTVSHVKIGEQDYFQIIIEDITEKKNAEEKLRESEEKFRTLFEGANDAIFLIKDYKFFECNTKTLDIFGANTESDVIGLFPWNLSPPSQPNGRNSEQVAIDYMNDALNGNSQRFYWKHKKIDDTLFDTEVSLNRILLENEYFLQAVVRDISEKLKAEQALMESEEKFRNLSDQSLMGILIAQDYKIKYVNRAYADIFGYSIEEMMKWELKDVINAIHEDDRDFPLQQLAKKQKGDSNDVMVHYSYRGIRKSGEIIWVDNFSKSILYEGRPADFVVQIDITDKILAEEKLKESEEKYRHISENANDLITVLNKDFKHEYINKEAYFKILGYSEKEILGKSIYEYLHPDDIRHMTKLKEIASSNFATLENFETQELRIKHKKGHYIWLEYTSKVFLDEQGEPKVIAILRDITERKEAERLIIEENKKLQELSKIREELITRISHELKTPVTTIYGASYALLDIHKKDMTRGILEFVEIMQRGSKRLKSLVENLLDISRIDSKVFKLNVKQENISEIIRDCVNDLRYFANERDITINLELPEELIINIDKIRIGQVVTNIISNAINNTLPRGKIFITIVESNDHIDIIIKDTGVGITENEKTRLFQKFGKIERFGKGDDVYIEGSGLGLYISKEFVELHGGKIFVESEGRNKGATFTLRLYRKIY